MNERFFSTTYWRGIGEHQLVGLESPWLGVVDRRSCRSNPQGFNLSFFFFFFVLVAGEGMHGGGNTIRNNMACHLLTSHAPNGATPTCPTCVAQKIQLVHSKKARHVATASVAARRPKPMESWLYDDRFLIVVSSVSR